MQTANRTSQLNTRVIMIIMLQIGEPF